MLEGTDPTDLRRGPGHYDGTALPGEQGSTRSTRIQLPSPRFSVAVEVFGVGKDDRIGPTGRTVLKGFSGPAITRVRLSSARLCPGLPVVKFSRSEDVQAELELRNSKRVVNRLVTVAGRGRNTLAFEGKRL